MNEGMPIQNPASPSGPNYEETTDYSKIYQIGLGILGFFLLVAIIFAIVFYVKANRTGDYIRGKVSEATEATKEADSDLCEQQKKDIQENPWMEYVARNTYGSFKFRVPRSWSKYEHFDVYANEPLRLFFSPDTVRYEMEARDDHAALEIIIGKRLYSGELSEIRNKLRRENPVEKAVKVSGFDGFLFIYNDKIQKRKVANLMVPFRDRTLFIRTSDYDKYSKYFEKFYKSFVLTP